MKRGQVPASLWSWTKASMGLWRDGGLLIVPPFR
jgi:hypothetical protein